MSHKGFSHVGLSTLDLDRTREFYEKVLGFKVVVADRIGEAFQVNTLSIGQR